MSRTMGDADADEPVNKRRRMEDGDPSSVGAPYYGAYTTNGAQSQYGSYDAPDMNSPQQASETSTYAPLQNAPVQGQMGGANTQAVTGNDNTQLPIAAMKQVDKVGVVEDLQTRVARLEKMLKVENAPQEEYESHTIKTGAAEVLVDLRHSHSSAINPKRSIMHQVGLPPLY